MLLIVSFTISKVISYINKQQLLIIKNSINNNTIITIIIIIIIIIIVANNYLPKIEILLNLVNVISGVLVRSPVRYEVASSEVEVLLYQRLLWWF